LLENDPPVTVGALYIAPMKALINDQFFRLTDLMAQSDIPLCHWHGDVALSKKKKFLQNPSGVLQITPESLEAMLINRVNDLSRIFGDLRFAVIDEMHAFMNAERGLQVLCQLTRLRKYMAADFRRIGLSATLGDYDLPAKWLSAGTNRKVSIPRPEPYEKKIRLNVEHFTGIFYDNEAPFEESVGHPALAYMYKHTLDKKAIIFSNSRPPNDAAIIAMRHIAAENGTPDIYHVHHGSVSATLREHAEQDIKNSDGPVVIGATVTMELGVDIGRLERVFQIGAPISVASFVQRLGRTGRRGEPPEMWFVHCEGGYKTDSPLSKIPWYLLKIIATIQLYIEDRWIEPPNVLKYSMSMLYHQIMSVIASFGEISVEALADVVLNLPAFTTVEKEDFFILLDELIKTEQLQYMDMGGLIIGLEGEKIVNSFEFFGVFPTEEEWIIMHESQKIGQVEEPVYAGEQVTVAGFNWLVIGVDHKRLTIFVKPLPDKLRYLWPGDRALSHNNVLNKMKQILTEDTVYPYLSPNAAERLAKARQTAAVYELDKYNVIETECGQVGILPWMGHRCYRTLRNILTKCLNLTITKKSADEFAPFCITLKNGKYTAADIHAMLKKALSGGFDPAILMDEEKIRAEKKHYEYKVPKYDRYVPNYLLKRQIIQDYIDIPFIKREVEGWGVKMFN
jgi:ATP-dependent Lhr-like helicase